MPMSRPTENLPDWFVTDPLRRVEPDGSRKLSGWIPLSPLPAQNENWLLYSVSLWLEYFRKTSLQYDAVIGSDDDCTHATLELAVADANITTNAMILLRTNITGAATVTSLTKAGWRIYAAPGVTFTKGVATSGISVAAPNIEIHNLRFAGFTTAGNKAIVFTSAGHYGRVINCSFAVNTDLEVDDTALAAGKLPAQYGNLTEV